MTVPSGFKKVSPKEMADLLNAIFKKKITILFKFDDAVVFRAKAMDEKSGVSMTIARPKSLDEDRHNKELTGHFQYDDQVYFFRAKVMVREKHLSMHFLDGIHKLIRRRDDRYKVPANMPMELITKRIGTTITFIRGDLIDLSMRGCRVGFHTPMSFKIGDGYNASLRFGAKRNPIAISGTIRQQVPGKKELFTTVFGLEITECEDNVKLREWITELQRAAFNSIQKK